MPCNNVQANVVSNGAHVYNMLDISGYSIKLASKYIEVSSCDKQY